MLETKEEYQKLKNAWSEICNSDEKFNLNICHFAIYAKLRGKDWKKCLSEHTTEDTRSIIANCTKMYSRKFKDLAPEDVLSQACEEISSEVWK